jgi:hypothetical protein
MENHGATSVSKFVGCFSTTVITGSARIAHRRFRILIEKDAGGDCYGSGGKIGVGESMQTIAAGLRHAGGRRYRKRPLKRKMAGCHYDICRHLSYQAILKLKGYQDIRLFSSVLP